MCCCLCPYLYTSNLLFYHLSTVSLWIFLFCSVLATHCTKLVRSLEIQYLTSSLSTLKLQIISTFIIHRYCMIANTLQSGREKKCLFEISQFQGQDSYTEWISLSTSWNYGQHSFLIQFHLVYGCLRIAGNYICSKMFIWKLYFYLDW